MVGRRSPPPAETPVMIELDGRIYSGSYSVDDGLIRVAYDFRRKTTRLGRTPPLILAKILLAELVRAQLRKAKPER